LKNSLSRNRRKKIALGCPINDFLRAGIHFWSPILSRFSEKQTFSTTTGVYTSNPETDYL
jgi:hypothetical protein